MSDALQAPVPPAIHSFKAHTDWYGAPQAEESLQVPAGTEVVLSWEVDAGATVELTEVVSGTQVIFDLTANSTTITAPPGDSDWEFHLVAVNIHDAGVWTEVFDNLPTLAGRSTITLNEFIADNFIRASHCSCGKPAEPRRAAQQRPRPSAKNLPFG